MNQDKWRLFSNICSDHQTLFSRQTNLCLGMLGARCRTLAASADQMLGVWKEGFTSLSLVLAFLANMVLLEPIGLWEVKGRDTGAPGRLSWLSVRPFISAQVTTSRFAGSSPASASALRAQKLLGMLSLLLSLPLPHSFSLSK